MSFLRVPLFTLISYDLLHRQGFCKECQNCLVALIKITTVDNIIITIITTCINNATPSHDIAM